MLKADGRYEMNVVGSHHQFKHPTQRGRVTEKYPNKDIPAQRLTTLKDSRGYASDSPGPVKRRLS